MTLCWFLASLALQGLPEAGGRGDQLSLRAPGSLLAL